VLPHQLSDVIVAKHEDNNSSERGARVHYCLGEICDGCQLRYNLVEMDGKMNGEMWAKWDRFWVGKRETRHCRGLIITSSIARIWRMDSIVIINIKAVFY